MANVSMSQANGIIDPDDYSRTVGVTANRELKVNIGGSTGTSDVNLTKVGGAAIALGQAAMAASLPVVIASNQSNVPVAAQATQNVIGNVGGKTVSVTVTPTVTTANAYGTNYVVGGLLTFSFAFTSTGTGIIQSVDVNIKKNETNGFTIFFFSANPSATTWTDAAVAAINATDMPLVRAPVPLVGNTQLAATGFSNFSAYGLGIAMAPGTTSLYAVLLANAALSTQFGSTSDVSVTVRVLQDA